MDGQTDNLESNIEYYFDLPLYLDLVHISFQSMCPCILSHHNEILMTEANVTDGYIINIIIKGIKELIISVMNMELWTQYFSETCLWKLKGGV